MPTAFHQPISDVDLLVQTPAFQGWKYHISLLYSHHRTSPYQAMSARSTMKALVTLGDGGFELRDVPIPSIEPLQILVKVVAAAQNPTDCTSPPYPFVCMQMPAGILTNVSQGRHCF
jgi:hypothetical protein